MSDPRRPVERSDLPPREGVWFAKPRPVRWGLKALPGYIACVWTPYYVALIACHLANAEVPRWITTLFFVATALYLIVWSVRTTVEWIVRRRGAQDRHFSDGLPGLREYPIEVIVKVNGETLGLDRGVLWFDDALLCFSGAAMSFVIAATDTVARDSKAWQSVSEKWAKDELVLSCPECSATVRLMLLWGLHRFAYRRALRTFRRERRPVERPRQWPPLRAYGEPPIPTQGRAIVLDLIEDEAARTGSSRGVVSS